MHIADFVQILSRVSLGSCTQYIISNLNEVKTCIGHLNGIDVLDNVHD